jgi:hypothetical protein
MDKEHLMNSSKPMIYLGLDDQPIQMAEVETSVPDMRIYSHINKENRYKEVI